MRYKITAATLSGPELFNRSTEPVEDAPHDELDDIADGEGFFMALAIVLLSFLEGYGQAVTGVELNVPN